MNDEIQKIATTWINLSEFDNNSKEYENSFWAWEAINTAVDKDPENAWNIILCVLEKTDSAKVIENLGAGHLEDMMCSNDSFTLSKIKNEILTNAKLKKCMSFVWLDSEDTNLYKDFYKLAGIPPVFEEVKNNKNT